MCSTQTPERPVIILAASIPDGRAYAEECGWWSTKPIVIITPRNRKQAGRGLTASRWAITPAFWSSPHADDMASGVVRRSGGWEFHCSV